MKLTPGQRNALVMLRANADRYGPTVYTRPYRVQERTIYKLADLGLVETREMPSTVTARITKAGREEIL